MKKYCLASCFTAAFILCSVDIVFGQRQGAFENELQQERRDVYQGGETQEEEQYYQEVNPENIPSGTDFYQTNHPLEEAPLQENPIPDSPLPENQIPENPI